MTAPSRTLVYGDHPDQVIDLYAPAATPTGRLVVVVHGGFWRQQYDRSHAVPQAQALAAAGHDVALLEYRRVRGDGGWPTTLLDVTLALRALAEEIRGGTLPGHTAVVGHSAGGMLAVLACGRAPVRAGLGLVAVVSLGGCLDLRMVDDLGLSDHAARELLGGGPEECPQRWVEADPRLLDSSALGELIVVALHGDADEEVPAAVSESFVDAHGDGRVEHRVLPGVGHYEPITPGTAAFETVLDHLSGLLAVA